MAKRKQRNFTPEFKAKVVFEALRVESSQVSELCRRHNINEEQLSKWKRQFLENVASLFESSPFDSNSLTFCYSDTVFRTIKKHNISSAIVYTHLNFMFCLDIKFRELRFREIANNCLYDYSLMWCLPITIRAQCEKRIT